MESLEIIDLRPLVILLNMAYIFVHSHKEWKDISSFFAFFLLNDLALFCVYLALITHYSNIPFATFLHSRASVQFAYRI